MNQKQKSKLFRLHKIGQQQWDAMSPDQQVFLTTAKAFVDITAAEFALLDRRNKEETFTDPETGMQFKVLNDAETAEFKAWAHEPINWAPGEPISPVWHPVTRAECQLMDKEAKSPPNGDLPPEPQIGDLGANNIGKRRGPSGPRTGDAMGAKPLVRKLLGTKVEIEVGKLEDGEIVKEMQYPKMTTEEICAATKKSDVNVRTILSDLRSPKYCGSGGVFKTIATKIDGKTYYQYQE